MSLSHWLKRFAAALRHAFSLCGLGCHRWSMPGGWCEECGMCDLFFGGHEDCGAVCRHWQGEG